MAQRDKLPSLHAASRKHGDTEECRHGGLEMSRSFRIAVLRDRFRNVVEEERRRDRRADFRGERVRLNLRVSQSLGQQLDELKRLSGTDKNAFCEQAIEQAVSEALAAVSTQRVSGGAREATAL
jgi:predicted transcriptional regulator